MSVEINLDLQMAVILLAMGRAQKAHAEEVASGKCTQAEADREIEILHFVLDKLRGGREFH